MALEFVREKDEERKSERAWRQQAEQEKQQAEQEKQAIGREESAVAGQRQAKERTRAMEEELALLKDLVKKLRKTNVSLFKSAGKPIVAEETQPEPEEGSIRSLEDELLLEKVKAERLQRKVDYLGPLVEGLKRQVSSEKKKTKRAKARVENLKANEPEEEPEQAAPGEEKGEGGGELLSAEDEKKVLMRAIKKRLKPGGKFGETAARLFKSFVEGGVSLNMTPQLLQPTSTVFHATGVQLKQDLNITCARNTVKVLALGITQLDGEELVKAVLRAPFLLIADDESLRNEDKKFPVFVAFHDVEADAPWFGLLRVCSMKDKTAETQAQLFYETIVDTLGYPKHQVLFVLSDNTASVSSEGKGCVKLLQRKLRGEDTTKKPPTRATGGASSNSAGRAGWAGRAVGVGLRANKRSKASGGGAAAAPKGTDKRQRKEKGEGGEKGEGKGKAKAPPPPAATRTSGRQRTQILKAKEGDGGGSSEESGCES
ncbi:unnamed protein product [Ectocarpus sp. CCAP 1310/34]|nr:unnamed protein product [Ectocarpus sp. CCAP 1310/34]